MSKFCSYCGTEIFESANNCPNCGAAVANNMYNDNYNNYNYYNNQNGYNQNGYNQFNNNYPNPYGNVNNSVVNNKVPGKGLSIAGMVLGIIATIWTIGELSSLGTIESELNTVNRIVYNISHDEYVVSFAIGYTLFAFLPSILGLIFSIVGLKKQKSGFNISGIVLNAIALSITFIIFVYIVTAF